MNDDSALIGTPDNDTVIITSEEKFNDEYERRLTATYSPDNARYSAILGDDSTSSDITLSWVSEHSSGPQSDKQKILDINSYVMRYINMDDILGMVVQSIQNNINTEIRHSYRNFGDQRNKTKSLDKARKIIDEFDEQIDVKRFICEAIITAYIEGNYCACLRGSTENYHVDQLPLSIVENSGYEIDGNPILVIDMAKLKEKIGTNSYKKRDGTSLFFNNTEELIQNNYRPEVLEAYQANDNYAKIDPQYSGMVRVNNFGRKYGLTPLFRALDPMLMLIQYQNADAVTAKSRAKKIIHQKMREKLLGTDGTRKAYTEMKLAHEQLMSAWKQKTVVVTTPPTVESISYVEPKTEDIAVEKVAMYRNKILSSLGVSFLANDNSQAASTSSLNLKQLMKCINRISEQVEAILERFYRVVLEENHLGPEFVPEVDIIDAEMMETSMKMEMARLLYTTFGCSRDTTFRILGLRAEDEKAKRELENNDDYDDVFMPHITSYTTSGNGGGSGGGGNSGGSGGNGGSGDKVTEKQDTQTQETDLDKQAKKEYDQQYNENKRALE